MTAGNITQDAFRDAHSAFITQFEIFVSDFLEKRLCNAKELSPHLAVLVEDIISFAARPGKRLRPFLVHCGWLAAGAGGRDILPVASAAELLHVFALIHDDVMDQSDLRRGLPTVHRIWQRKHSTESLRGEADNFGESIAILAGDLAIAWSDIAMDSFTSIATHDAVRRLWNETREEVILGQYLDVHASFQTHPVSEDQIWTILSLKSGKYSLERPLQLGAVAAGGSPALVEALSGFGAPLGRAFQIQDDILGLMGSPDQTGKPTDSDLREGKSTLLVSRAYSIVSEAEQKRLLKGWGRHDATDEEINEARQIIMSSGALESVCATAESEVANALNALESIAMPDTARDILAGLAGYIIARTT